MKRAAQDGVKGAPNPCPPRIKSVIAVATLRRESINGASPPPIEMAALDPTDSREVEGLVSFDALG